ncbi:MAG: lipid A biosynthesis (KDO)2-(lauroyl)-lipid IVA acyltransferase [Tannerella sp.]|jgi:predicted LPLAT superfamily acyltransferase|nr:lipid A biosynthesis (KDO)2-(lauroyl)-lipid IVA acyltransferase [Tannerella sp.]
MVKKEKDWKGVTGGHTLGQKALKITFSIVNVRVGYVIMALTIPFYMLFRRKGYLSIYRYFRHQHGYSPLKAFGKTYRNHYLFGQMLLDRFAVYAGQNDVFKVENPDNDLFLRMLDDPRGCIIAGSHVGNPELCGYLLKQKKKRINSLIFGGEAKEVQENRSRILEDNHVRLIPVSDDLSHVFLLNEALSNGEIVNMPCDRSFGSNKCVECDFLRGKADFPIGAFVLALQFKTPVLALFVLKISALRYRIHVIAIPPPPNDLPKRMQINEMTRTFVRELERIVHIYPEQWFNFYNFWKK